MKINTRKIVAESIFASASAPSGVPETIKLSRDATNPYAFIASVSEPVTAEDGSVVNVTKRFRVLVKEVD